MKKFRKRWPSNFKRVGNLEVDIDRLMRSRTIGYKIDERFLKRFVGSISK